MTKNCFTAAARTTEALDPRYSAIERLPPLDSMTLQVAAHQEALGTIKASLPEIAAIVDKAAARLHAYPQGRVIGTGAGTPGRIWNTVLRAWDFRHSDTLMAGGCGAIFRSVEGAEDDGFKGEEEIAALNVGAGDIVIGIAASGTTPYTIGTVRAAERAGAMTIGIANNPGAPLLTAGGHGICMPTGPEVVAGSTRMKAGTAQKVILNMLTTAISERKDALHTSMDNVPSATLAGLTWQLDAHIAAIGALNAKLPIMTQANDSIVQRLKQPGARLICIGSDTEGRIAVQDLVELTPTYGWPPQRTVYVLEGGDDAMFTSTPGVEGFAGGLAKIKALKLTPNDVVIAAGGGRKTDFAQGGLKAAGDMGALRIAFADDAGSPLLPRADYGVSLAHGIDASRLEFGTALKVALNTVSTQAMIGLHHVFKGMMVDMQAKNEKLKKRAIRMVTHCADCDEDTAVKALAEDQNIKTAIVIAFGVAAAKASAALERNGGDLHRTLAFLAQQGVLQHAPSP